MRPRSKRRTYKPTRVIARRGEFYFAHYDDELGYTVYPRTHIKLDIEPPKDKSGKPNYESNPKWWRKSKHALQIVEKLASYERRREARFYGLEEPEDPPDVGSIEEVMEEFNAANAEDRDDPLSDRVLENRKLAIRFLRLFFPTDDWRRLTRKDFIQLRTKAKTGIQIGDRLQKYKGRSIETYFGHLRALYSYAKTQGYVQDNPLENVSVKVEDRPIVQIEREDLERILIFLYHHNPKLFTHIDGQHLLAFRVSEGCGTITREQIDFKRGQFNYWNAKARRWEVIPFGEAMRRHFETAIALNPNPLKVKGRIAGTKLYPFSHRRTVARLLLHAQIYTGIRPFTSHDLKRFAAAEFAAAKPDPRTLDLAVHHAPSVNQLVVDKYSGKDLRLLHELYVTAQDPHWVPFYDRLPDTKWPVPKGKKYVWYYKTKAEFLELAKEWDWPYSYVLEDEENEVLDGDESDD